MNYAEYVRSVNEQLGAQGFAPLPMSDDLSERFAAALEREESWGRLMIVLTKELNLTDSATQGALVSAAGAWVRSVRSERPVRLILLFPFDRKVSAEESDAITGLREEGPEGRWGVLPWVGDLDVGLLDQHTGFPPVDPAVARALTEVPRGRVEVLVRRTTGPRVGRPRLLLSLDQVPATRVILASTVAYYLWSVMMGGGLGALLSGPGGISLLTWGANYTGLTLNGQQWRLLSYMFLHGGLMHLGFNMWAFWQLGRYVEVVFGSGRMLFIYFLAGILGGVASVAVRPAVALSVGASGGIMGLMGALIYFGLTFRDRPVNWHGLWGPVVVNLLFGLFVPMVDNYAHVGGFVGGFLAAFLAGAPGQRKLWRQVSMGVVGVVVALVLAGVIPVRHIMSILG